MQNRTYIAYTSGNSCAWCQWRYSNGSDIPDIPPKVSHYWLNRHSGMWQTFRAMRLKLRNR
jgi:hypothetical protein